MSYNAWMPLQGTNAQKTMGNYMNSVKKTKNQDKSEKDQDSFWKLDAESYEPSAEAMKYRTNKVSADKTSRGEEAKLSKSAQKLLAELKEKYGNMDFFVASYSSDEEAQRYLNRGTKEYSVLIDPETLEAMANDSEVRKQYEDVLAGAGDKLAQLKDELGEDADNVNSFGISIDKEGKVSYFAELDKISESRQKQLDSAKTKKAEEKAKAKKAEKKAKQDKMKDARETEFVKADSIEELIEKIKNSFAEDGKNAVAGGFNTTT